MKIFNVLLTTVLIVVVIPAVAQKVQKDTAMAMITGPSSAQEVPNDILTAIVNDDSVKLATFVSPANVNVCYGNYSLLSDAIRGNARKCFALLIADGADVNLVCNGYVPPLMHAVKYGRLDMVRVLLSKGANVHFQYEGDDPAIKDATPLTYAQKFNRTEIVAYLQTLK